MQLTSRHDLVFVTATVTYRQSQIEIPDVLIDTGAASSIIDADLAGELGIFARRGDDLRTLRGVGGKEHVFMRHVDRFAIGPHGIDNFHLEFGEVNYGFPSEASSG